MSETLAASQPQKRWHSLDALRGLDTLFIVGLTSALSTSSCLMPERLGDWIRVQTEHAVWEGCTINDFFFPIFVFISGASMYFSISRSQEKGRAKFPLIVKLLKRAAILVFFGMLVNGKLTWDMQEMRFCSVLGLIGLSCAGAGCIALIMKQWWQRLLAAVAVLLIVGGLQYFGGDMTMEGCVNARIDALLCPGKLHHEVIDPEGPLCVFSAVALCLSGFLAGEALNKWSCAFGARWRSALALAGVGVILLLLAGYCGPIIKKIWTPAFVLQSAGVSYICLAVFHWLFDGKNWGITISMPLRVIGVNAIFTYMITHVIPLYTLSQRIFCGLQDILLPEPYVYISHLPCMILLTWLLCYYLWRRKIFFKV